MSVQQNCAVDDPARSRALELGEKRKMAVLKTLISRSVALSIALGLTAFVAVPTADAYNKRVQRACLADYKNLCPQYRHTSPQLRVCMESKANEISWGCIEALIDSGEVDKKRVVRR
jgi:flagellar biosynthesis protein FliP